MDFLRIEAAIAVDRHGAGRPGRGVGGKQNGQTDSRPKVDRAVLRGGIGYGRAPGPGANPRAIAGGAHAEFRCGEDEDRLVGALRESDQVGRADEVRVPGAGLARGGRWIVCKSSWRGLRGSFILRANWWASSPGAWPKRRTGWNCGCSGRPSASGSARAK